MAMEMVELTDEQFIAALLKRPAESRAQIAEELLESLRTDEEKRIERLWVEEAKRRLQACREGRMELIPADEVFREVRARLQP